MEMCMPGAKVFPSLTIKQSAFFFPSELNKIFWWGGGGGRGITEKYRIPLLIFSVKYVQYVIRG